MLRALPVGSDVALNKNKFIIIIIIIMMMNLYLTFGGMHS